MQELNMEQVDAVSGGWGKLIVEAIVAGAAYDIAKSAFTYAMANSYMGRGKFPPEIRAGHE
jgi:hypothetical protein